KNEGISASELYPYLSKLNIQTYLTIDLIDNTLNWVKANSRSSVVNKTSFSPLPILEELSALYNDYIQLKCIQVEMRFDQEITLFSDKDIFKVIVRNLFVNALKFSKPGGKIYLKAEKTSDQHRLICIEDEGIGMTSDELERFFSKESYTCSGTLNENGAGR
ncbi:sensor histidine kinase, partial [Leptospira bandrabouensis]|uniref:sensor histidine kinase n=1 Tax=Leptospira bandrabouensis TaxID=2484903 RepID=UPI001EE9925A